jgi:hypothetical protein
MGAGSGKLIPVKHLSASASASAFCVVSAVLIHCIVHLCIYRIVHSCFVVLQSAEVSAWENVNDTTLYWSPVVSTHVYIAILFSARDCSTLPTSKYQQQEHVDTAPSHHGRSYSQSRGCFAPIDLPCHPLGLELHTRPVHKVLQDRMTSFFLATSSSNFRVDEGGRRTQR